MEPGNRLRRIERDLDQFIAGARILEAYPEGDLDRERILKIRREVAALRREVRRQGGG